MSVKVFISSTFIDLVDYRKKTFEVIERSGLQGIRMETFGAREENSTNVCYAEIEEADIFVGIYAHRYGFVPEKSATSITEMEYDFAIVKNKPVFCCIINEDYPWKPAFIDRDSAHNKLVNFKNKVGKSFVYDIFGTPDDLAVKVATSINRYLYKKLLKEKLEEAAITQPLGSEKNRDQVTRRASLLSSIIKGCNLLLVNDVPEEMNYAIEIYEAIGINVTIAKSSEKALSLLSTRSYDIIVSDMARGNIKDEGMRFLNEVRSRGLLRPLIFTVGDYLPQLGLPPYAFGITNRVDELLNLTFDIIERIRG